MKTEDLEPQMDADGHGFILKPETEAIIGCAFEVLNELGHGLLEKPYENALGRVRGSVLQTSRTLGITKLGLQTTVGQDDRWSVREASRAAIVVSP
jgi:hypothetical protein